MSLKDNYLYSIIQGQEPVTRQTQQALFCWAYATMDRLEGNCSLTVVWKGRGHKKEKEIHNYQLRFNHEGIKDYQQKKAYRDDRGEWPFPGRTEYTSLTLPEAAALIQDSYYQNVHFGTRPAEGYKQYSFMLEYDTSALDRGRLLLKLSPQHLTPQMFANVILTAVRKLDNILLYDLSGPQRRAALGNRDEFLLRYGEEYRQMCFLKTGILDIDKDGRVCRIKAYAIVSTPQEQLLRLGFRLIVVCAEDQFYLEEFVVTENEELAGDHPDNPLNYEVFCAVYRLNGVSAIMGWLDQDPDIFMIGELHDRQCYKWMQSREVPWLEYDITDKILAEFIVTRHELIIYAKRTHHLVRMERIAGQKAPGLISGYKRVCLSVRKLYELLLSGQLLNPADKRRTSLREYGAASALLRVGQEQLSYQFLQDRIECKVMLGLKCWYLFCRKKAGPNTDETVAEYYIDGNWLLVNVLKGDPAQVMADFERIPGTAVIFGSEVENHDDMFAPPVTEQRKWQIYGLLKRFDKEGGLLKEMGLAPALKDVAQAMGALKSCSAAH